MERVALPLFSGVLAATPSIRESLERCNPRVENVNNFPLLGELHEPSAELRTDREIAYVGGISEIRGAKEMVRAAALCEPAVRLHLAGPCATKLLNELKEEPGWSRVVYWGEVDRSQVRAILSRSVAGLVLFHPEPNHVDAQPNKLFEYMSAGIPVIASDFPLWRSIVASERIGLCVDPLSPVAIAAAVSRIVGDNEMAVEFGARGLRLVITKYNWTRECEILFNFYRSLISE